MEKEDPNIFNKYSRESKLAKNLEGFLVQPYEQIKTLIDKVISDNSTIIDIGANDGTLETYIDDTKQGCKIRCIDVNQEALSNINNIQFKNSSVETQLIDGNLFIEEYEDDPVDCIVLNATLHELNNPLNQAEYLDNFFENVKKLLNEKGLLIIGDHYYPEHVSDQEVEDYRLRQLREVGHADEREKFINPELIKEKSLEHEYNIESFNQIQSVEGIDRQYYIFLLRKLIENSK